MITSEVCVQKFKDDYRFRLAEKSINLYLLATEQLLDYCSKPFYELTTRDIRNWLVHLEDNEYKPITVKSKLAGIKLFYKYCKEEELVKHDPAVSIPFPEIEDRLPHYLEHSQLLQLRRIVENRVDERAVIEVLYATGVRIGELVAMKKEEINWSERIITIPNGKRKKARMVLFTRYCGEYLRKYLDERDDDHQYVFVNPSATGPASIRTIQDRFMSYKKDLGIHLSPHTLRHTFAAHLAIKGMPLACIQDLLGHDSPHQTQLYARLYSHARKEMYDEWM
ncbi:tyrosine-type recombinase/integrase [Metabacillus halosaccharovorans]|uniref:tyrosine-type recombinase/integrase n=1 Tax=Metabacillus halosaccharovorans TaxID=930124 RepID=UPI0020A7984D|nr:tyrosine-type recombinase/integrase [Metabacillus halosaccharovorans]